MTDKEEINDLRNKKAGKDDDHLSCNRHREKALQSHKGEYTMNNGYDNGNKEKQYKLLRHNLVQLPVCQSYLLNR